MIPGESSHIRSRRPLNRLAVWTCIAATTIAVHTCLQIEWWNARAGILPRQPQGDGNPKWRSAAESGVIAGGNSDVEQAQFLGDSEKRHAEARLRDWVETAGLAQYGIAPFAFLLSVFLLARAESAPGRSGFAALAILSGSTIVIMLCRGYLTSLGW